ncbi:glycosyltransferase [Actinomycetes bacterium M1A6_2h]
MKADVSAVNDAVGSIPVGAKVLWVASTGGHLAQLHRLSSLFETSSESVWVTFETPQSDALLADRRVFHVDYVHPRDMAGAVRAARKVLPLLRNEQFDYCVSTGAALAAFVLPMARARGTKTMYIESVSRTLGPSLTGKIMRRIPGIKTYTQHASWADRRWSLTKSVLDAWTPTELSPVSRPMKVVVTLGTIKPYRFDRLVDAVLKILSPHDEVVWQLGVTSRDDLPGTVYDEIAADELRRLQREADVVVTHAGVGSLLGLLDDGISPVLGVRAREFGEHVDDHQDQIASAMCGRGLAARLDLSTPSRATLELAAATRISSLT